MTACKEEKTWSTSLPETVIIYKFTIFHWLRARLDKHSVELHYGTVLTIFLREEQYTGHFSTRKHKDIRQQIAATDWFLKKCYGY